MPKSQGANFLTFEDALNMRADKPPFEHSSSLDSLLSLIQALPDADEKPAGTKKPEVVDASNTTPPHAEHGTPMRSTERTDLDQTPRAQVKQEILAPLTPTPAAAATAFQRAPEAPTPKFNLAPEPTNFAPEPRFEYKGNITPGQAINEGRVLCYKKKQTKKATLHLLDELFSAPVLCQPIKQRHLPASFYTIEPPHAYVICASTAVAIR